MMALIGTFTFEFEVSLPLLARTTFHGGDTAYSWLLGALVAGAVAACVLVGAASVTFLATGSATIQLASKAARLSWATGLPGLEPVAGWAAWNC